MPILPEQGIMIILSIMERVLGAVLNLWKKVLLSSDDSLDKAIKVLHNGGFRIALVVDKSRKLLGTVTDGDIRRALINKLTMKSLVGLIMNSNPITVDNKATNKEMLHLQH